MPVTILADNGYFKVEVSEIRDGCRAVFFQKLRGWRRISHTVYDLPFHASLDAAHSMVQSLLPFRTI